MTKLPRGVSATKVVNVLKRMGFYVRRQRGSHIIMRRENPFAQVVVPFHRSLDTGTLDKIIKDAGLTSEEFVDLLK